MLSKKKSPEIVPDIFKEDRTWFSVAKGSEGWTVKTLKVVDGDSVIDTICGPCSKIDAAIRLKTLLSGLMYER